MGLVAIGPVTISHGNPSFSSSASPTGHGIRSRRFGGSCSWAAANVLDGLVSNSHARTTIDGHTGVVEWLEFDDAMLSSWTGYYLLEDFTIDAGQRDSLATTDCPFTLTAAYVGALA